ncbi:MAG: hypothetical protein COA57_08180 [Flavobacteriales bacterium]|nr:MAG: hypothetical protein COA57_08180 [Flavobacteriales bacterium]
MGSSTDEKQILNAINAQGFLLIEGVLDLGFVEKTGTELLAAIEKENEYHGTTEYEDFGRVLFAPIYGGTFIKTLENEKLMRPFEIAVSKNCILYTMTSSCLSPHGSNYTSRIHKDTKIFIPNFIHMLAAMILLDDFTEKNGAPLFLPASHKNIKQPAEDYFNENAVQITGKAGSVLYFNPNVWHCSTKNNTGKWRKCLLLGMQHHWLKQRFDIPKAMEHIDLSNYSEKVLQRLGFNSEPPSSYREYYENAKKGNQKTTNDFYR